MKANAEAIKYVQVNFQSMKLKPLWFRYFMESTNDNNTVFGFTETWLGENDNTEFWCFDKSKIIGYRCDRPPTENVENVKKT